MNNIQQYILPIRGMTYNAYYRIMRNRYIISKKGREFRENVKAYFKNKDNVFCHTKPIKITLDFYLKYKRKLDCDNLLKGIIDACKEILYCDDSQIYEIHCRKFIGQDNDEIHIEVSELAI